MFIVGFDLGKRKSQLCVLEQDGRVAAELRIDTTREALSKCFERFSAARVLIEASTSSDWVSRHLESIGCEVVVGDPRFGPMYARADKKLKTDKRDARALAKALRIGAFRAANRKSESSRKVRAAVLARHALVTSRTRLINQVRALCEREGIIVKRCAAEAFARRFEELHMEDWLFEAVAGVVIEIECLNEMIATQDALLTSMLDADPIAQRFEQVRGIGILTALMFKSVVEDPSRFESARHVASYLGLVPRERSSGEKRHLGGGITKTGDTLTRSYLLQAAWSMMKKSAPSSPMKEWALRIAERRGKQKAATALARKLSRVLFALWRDGTSFTQPDSGAAAAVEDVA